MTDKLLIATGNRGKAKEYGSLLKGVPLTLVTLADEGIEMDVEETGSTFEANAGLKAKTLAAASGLLTLADDSGLEVDALNGEPGVYSARYAGPDATDTERVRYLLSKLEGVPEDERTARFRCVIAIAEPGEPTAYFSGSCDGFITLQPAGDKGFGYDPVFFVPELNKTMSELEPDVKNSISHRAKAAERARAWLINRYNI